MPNTTTTATSQFLAQMPREMLNVVTHEPEMHAPIYGDDTLEFRIGQAVKHPIVDAYVVTDRPDAVVTFMAEQGWTQP